MTCDMVMDAIMAAAELKFSLPQTKPQYNEVARGFSAISSSEVLTGCVSCVDGMLLKINTPSKNETGHVKSYYSGYYCCYGMNVQAVCNT